jgi:uncharacterized protein
MGRILFFVLLAMAIYIAWRYLRIKQRSDGDRPQSRPRPDEVPEAIVRCDVCGLNLPQSEALPAPGADPKRWYCCEEHRRQGAAR